MEIKRNGANGRRAQSVSHNGILYTSGITTTDLDADITGQTQDVIHIIDNILARNGIDKTRVLTAAITLADMADTARSTPCGTPGSWTAMNRRAASRAASWPCRNTKLKFR